MPPATSAADKEKKRAQKAATKGAKKTKKGEEDEEGKSEGSDTEEEEDTDVFKEQIMLVVHLPGDEVEIQVGHTVKYRVKNTPN
jgi:hypothetical protein